jgi:hypothetical protein
MEVSLDACACLIIAFLNIGKFFEKIDGSSEERDPVFYAPQEQPILPSDRVVPQTSLRFVIVDRYPTDLRVPAQTLPIG